MAHTSHRQRATFPDRPAIPALYNRTTFGMVADSPMHILLYFLLTLHILVCVLMVLVVLMQRPRSEGLGAAFGGGMTENIFGAQTTHVLAKFTTWLGGAFFLLTLALAIVYANINSGNSTIQRDIQKLAAEQAAAPKPAASPSPAPTGAPLPAAPIDAAATPAAATVAPAAAETPAAPAATPAAAEVPLVPAAPATPAPATP